ncbi:conserved hypothetical protein [Paraburkholderia tropica]|uniref:hypothetical protein n=1 Tax=Paraburkholderia tropica TaxID=92647 RepID=UPI001CAE6F74|nr:hypothetical protein [Paraburkholderia tropica]CAG9236946.1 conserved hypothetical protein [Paraburkholderia tropica]
MSNELKKSVRARASAKHECGVTEIRVEFDRSVLGAYQYEFNGVIVARCFVSDSYATPYGFLLAFHPSWYAELDEMRAATKKLEAMHRSMEKQRKALGESATFSEFARRAMIAAGAKEIFVAPVFGKACRVDEIAPLGPKQGAEILHAIGSLESKAIELYAKKAA